MEVCGIASLDSTIAVVCANKHGACTLYFVAPATNGAANRNSQSHHYNWRKVADVPTYLTHPRHCFVEIEQVAGLGKLALVAGGSSIAVLNLDRPQDPPQCTQNAAEWPRNPLIWGTSLVHAGQGTPLLRQDLGMAGAVGKSIYPTNPRIRQISCVWRKYNATNVIAITSSTERLALKDTWDVVIFDRNFTRIKEVDVIRPGTEFGVSEQPRQFCVQGNVLFLVYQGVMFGVDLASGKVVLADKLTTRRVVRVQT